MLEDLGRFSEIGNTAQITFPALILMQSATLVVVVFVRFSNVLLGST